MGEPPTYVKADGGPAGCPDRDQVDTAEECRIAGESYFNTNLNTSTTWLGVGAICRGVYEKAAGATTCRNDQMVKTAEECRIAGATVGHPFDKVVTTDHATDLDRPGGCFWDQNGFTYFNTNFSTSTT